MQRVKKADSILVLGKCSRLKVLCLKIRVAAILFAATLLLYPASASAYSVKAEGGSVWLCEIVERSLTAVVERISPEQSDEAVRKVIEVVSNKLFSGYTTESVSVKSGNIKINLVPVKVPLVWKVELQIPQIQDPPLSWIKSDIAQIENPMAELIQGLPVEALSWCDSGLKDEVIKLMMPVLPGWRPSLLVLSDAENLIMRISFTPELPLVLAVNPKLNSNSLPTLLHDELREDLMQRSAPFIGLPVAWAEIHEKEINLWAETFLEDRGIVGRTAAVPKAVFSAGQVSQLNVRVESRLYTISAWAALYAGIKDKSGEFGIHLGRKFNILSQWNTEFYGEGIVELQDWNPEARLGMRWSPWGDVWIGGEWSTKDNMWWGRFNIDPRLNKPYAWIRLREDGEYNAAVGWKATSYVSFELYYDSRYESPWGLRILGNL